MSISAARLAAFKILSSLQLEGGNLADRLHSNSASSLNEKDRSLTTELVYGVLRRQLQLDWILSQVCRTEIGRLDYPVLLALRLGAYQILFLSRIPVSAAVDESVELVKRARIRSAGAIVNAVLRRVDRDCFQAALNALDPHSNEALAIRYSHPSWLIARWRERFGDEATTRILKTSNLTPSTFFRMNSPLHEDDVLREITGFGLTIEPHPLVKGCWKVLGGDLRRTTPFQDGRIYIQDPASQMIPDLLGIAPGDFCLDLCAAPGGKLSRLAWLSRGKSLLVGMDLSWERLHVAAQLHLRRWPTLALIVADGRSQLPFSIKFDRILVDAPCSGTGTMQRNPDIRWRVSLSDFSRHQIAQLAILKNAAQYLKIGGTMVYSTCSLEEEENECVVMSFLECSPDFKLERCQDPRFDRFFNARCFFQCLPSEWNGDGFFAAVLRRKELAR